MNRIYNLHKIRLKHGYGQNFIIDLGILRREIEYANINKKDIVLEIGAGIGNLTELLAQTAKRVIAIEKDKQFSRQLHKLRVKYNNIDLIFGDALKIDFPKFNKVVANLPYKISLPIIFKLLEYDFDLAVLTLQKTQARRICARAGQEGYSRIGISIYRKADAEFLKIVPSNAFYPESKVESAIIRLKKTLDKFKIPSEEYFKKALDFIFLRRSKSIEQAILSLKNENISESVEEVLTKLRPIKNIKVDQLAPEQFGEVVNVLHQKNIKIPEVSAEFKRKAQKFIK